MGKFKKLHDHVTKNIVTSFILNSRRASVQTRPNLYKELNLNSRIPLMKKFSKKFQILLWRVLVVSGRLDGGFQHSRMGF